MTNPRGGLLGCTEVIRQECARYKVKAKTLTLHNRCVETHAGGGYVARFCCKSSACQQSRVVTLLTVSRVMQSVRLGHTRSPAHRGDEDSLSSLPNGHRHIGHNDRGMDMDRAKGTIIASNHHNGSATAQKNTATAKL